MARVSRAQARGWRRGTPPVRLLHHPAATSTGTGVCVCVLLCTTMADEVTHSRVTRVAVKLSPLTIACEYKGTLALRQGCRCPACLRAACSERPCRKHDRLALDAIYRAGASATGTVGAQQPLTRTRTRCRRPTFGDSASPPSWSDCACPLPLDWRHPRSTSPDESWRRRSVLRVRVPVPHIRHAPSRWTHCLPPCWRMCAAFSPRSTLELWSVLRRRALTACSSSHRRTRTPCLRACPAASNCWPPYAPCRARPRLPSAHLPKQRDAPS